MKSTIAAALAAIALSATPATAQEADMNEATPYDISVHDDALAIEPTQMLNLGSAHFSGWREFVNREELDMALAPVLDRLEAWGPDTITVEAISGADCDQLERYGTFYAGAADTYCVTISEAAAHGDMSREDANIAAMETFLSGGPGDDPAARRNYVAQLMAAGEIYSALLQWRYLDPAERIAGEEVSQGMIDSLERFDARLKESVSIGVALAQRLGHERVWQVDDHSADMLYLRNADGFGERMREIWSSGSTEGREMYAGLMAKVQQDRDLTAFLIAMNDPEAQRLTIEGDFAKGLADTDERGIGQDYANWWQVRNMRMVANIVAAASLNRSQKTLNIVGASHKAYYDYYLDTMHHVELVDVGDILSQ
ncbi:DUF5694 domain-containing protein [Sphingomicrobium sediminis]|uniref:DUF5694 domain-containing protein n=1 Tax=Sphingomicrobium sediminis TaxID=2950949 RepID=A0A9X2EIX3_9SPHN|nr:DUF5694 domain-containing protein [Sphingomicrobium sediminis]MCM8558350.1 DUF5694 domain-containing protein [Sphingomicrobium sediminis]